MIIGFRWLGCYNHVIQLTSAVIAATWQRTKSFFIFPIPSAQTTKGRRGTGWTEELEFLKGFGNLLISGSPSIIFKSTNDTTRGFAAF